jgi:hypothetical protein
MTKLLSIRFVNAERAARFRAAEDISSGVVLPLPAVQLAGASAPAFFF